VSGGVWSPGECEKELTMVEIEKSLSYRFQNATKPSRKEFDVAEEGERPQVAKKRGDKRIGRP
jgi:hypothetical protein